MILTNARPFILKPLADDDELVRRYVSRLWAEDWDSPEDSAAYDGGADEGKDE